MSDRLERVVRDANNEWYDKYHAHVHDGKRPSRDVFIARAVARECAEIIEQRCADAGEHPHGPCSCEGHYKAIKREFGVGE